MTLLIMHLSLSSYFFFLRPIQHSVFLPENLQSIFLLGASDQVSHPYKITYIITVSFISSFTLSDKNGKKTGLDFKSPIYNV
jgi:hypothetical protein